MPLTTDEVRKIASLSRLALGEAEAEPCRARLEAVIGYVERLRSLDLRGVEPLAHVGGDSNRLRDDTPGPTLPVATLMAMAPDSSGPFVKIPKVMGDVSGGSA